MTRHIDHLFRDFLRQIEEQFEIDIEEEDPVFPIEVVCKLADLHYWTLRNFIKEGIIEPKKVGKTKFSYLTRKSSP